jgi:hypothetical protein
MPSLSFLLRLCGKPKSSTKSKPIQFSEKAEYARPASVAQKPITVAASRNKTSWPLDEPTPQNRTPRVTERPSSLSGDTISLENSHSSEQIKKTIRVETEVRKPVVQTPVVPAKEILYQISTGALDDAEITAQFISHQIAFQNFIQEAYIEDCNLKEAEEIIRQIRTFGRQEAFQDTKFPQLLLETWFWMKMKCEFEKAELLPECYREMKQYVASGDRPHELDQWRGEEIARICESQAFQDHLAERIESIALDLETLTKSLNTNTHLPKRKLIAYQAEQAANLRSLVATIACTFVQWEAQPETFKFIYPTSAGWLEPGKIENIAKRGALRDSVIDDNGDEKARFSGGIIVPMLMRRDERVLTGGVTLVPAWARIQLLSAAEKRWSGTIDQYVSNKNYETSSSW